MSFLDSSFIPFPGLNDLALIVMASHSPGHALYYAFMSTFGSVLGCYVIYGLARGGRSLAKSRPDSSKGERAQRWLARNDFVAMLVMCLLPPPAPLKVFVAAAGVLRMNLSRFGAALLVGRALRFAAESWLGARFGVQAEAYLKKNLAWASLVTIVIVIGLTFLSRWWKGRRPDGLDESG